MIRKTTMNMCGTLGPYGIAVTSLRPSALPSCKRDTRRRDCPAAAQMPIAGRMPANTVSAGSCTTPRHKPVSTITLSRTLVKKAEETVPVARHPKAQASRVAERRLLRCTISPSSASWTTGGRTTRAALHRRGAVSLRRARRGSAFDVSRARRRVDATASRWISASARICATRYTHATRRVP